MYNSLNKEVVTNMVSKNTNKARRFKIFNA